jgi:putative cell wall-binding protein
MKSFKQVAFTFIIILFSTSALAQDQNTTELFLDKDAEVLLEP